MSHPAQERLVDGRQASTPALPREPRPRWVRVALIGVVVLVAATIVGVVLRAEKTSPPAVAPPGESRFLSFGPDVYDFTPGPGKTIDGIALRLTEGGDFQVTRDTMVLWSTRTSATCADNCRVVLQSDGNLVLHGPEGALWASGTWGSTGATLLFQPRSPYLTIRDAAYDIVWISDGNEADAPRGMLSSTLDGSRATSVRAFLDSLAVNTHMDQYERDAAVVQEKLDYLGIRTIRDHYAEDGSLLENYRYLAEHGIRFDMLHYSSEFDVLLRDAGTMAALPNNALIAVEGPNEINNFPFTCAGSTWKGGWPNANGPAAQCFMENYYDRIRADRRFDGVHVYDLTGNVSVADPDRYGLLTLDGKADLGNIHPYPRATQQPGDVLLSGLGGAYLDVPPDRAVITETGYQSSEVGERAQAVYYLNTYLSTYRAGFRKTYVYELTDNQHESHGFFDTTNQPKAAATALHNLTTILADAGTPREGVLDYSVSGLPAKAYTLALQRSDGSVDLVLWDERPIRDENSDLTPGIANVQVNLKGPFSSVSVYDPVRSTTPVQELHDVSSVNVALAGEPVVLRVVP